MKINLFDIDHSFNEIIGRYNIVLDPDDEYITDIHCNGNFYVDVFTSSTDISLDEVHKYSFELMDTIEQNEEVIRLIKVIHKKLTHKKVIKQ